MKLVEEDKSTPKVPGPDGILAGIISKPVCAIFNSSVREGMLPPVRKLANVTPFPKVCLLRLIESELYTISLTPILTKHLEAIVGQWILDSISDKINPAQYGGLKGLSTTHTLINMIHNWHTAIHSSQTVCILFLDYTKAFVLVNHNILVSQFQRIANPSEVALWFSVRHIKEIHQNCVVRRDPGSAH